MQKMTVSCAVLVGVCVLAGCGLWPLPDGGGNTDNTDNTPTAKPVVYQVGEFAGVLSDDIEQFVTLQPLDETKTDKAVVIAGSEVTSLTPAQQDAVKAIFDARHPVALLHADLTQILFLQRTILGNTSFDYDFPDNEVYVEIYAVDHEADGNIWQWSQFPPPAAGTGYTEESEIDLQEGDTESTTTTDPEDISLGDDNDAWQDSRVKLFAQWLAENGSRSETPLAVAAKSRAMKDAGDNSLTELASAFVEQGNFSQSGNNYQLSHFVYKCHSLSSDPSRAYDWFYVQQYCVFNGSGAYTINERMNRGLYLDQIEINAWMKGFDNNPAAVSMIQSSPQTENKQTQITSGVSWNIGGEVGLDTNGPSGKLSLGVSISNVTTLNVSDCEVKNLSNDKGNNVHWLYQFRRASIGGVGDCFWQNCLVGPPYLSNATFQPMNQWIWKMTPEVRARKAPMYVQCRVQLCRSQEKWKFFTATLTHYFTATPWSRSIYIPYPPTTAE